jgi:hypothetical protein
MRTKRDLFSTIKKQQEDEVGDLLVQCMRGVYGVAVVARRVCGRLRSGA